MSANWNIRVGTVVYCEVDEFGWYGVQCEGLSEDGSGLSDQLQLPYGFAARPVDAAIDAEGNIDVGCQAFRASLGRTKSLSWLGHDPRYTNKCPPLTPGSSAIWNHKGAKLLLDAAENTSTWTVPLGDGTSHVITVGTVNGVRKVTIDHADGSKVELLGSRINVTAGTVHVNSANVLLGAAPGRQVACVGDLVSGGTPPMQAGPFPVIPVGALPTTTGGVPIIGQIISGRSGVLA